MALKTAARLPKSETVTDTRPPVDYSGRAGRWKVFSIAFAIFFVAMGIWALASPIGSVPDEPSHAIRAAEVVRGQIDPPPWNQNKSLAAAEVPAYVAWMHERTCYVGQTKVTPACEAGVPGDPNRLVSTGTSAQDNSPVYYAIVGLPTLFLSGDLAIFSMRFLNVLICAAALAVMVMQLSMLRRSRWAIAGAAVGLTPMVLFLAGSINPNAIEAASAGALFATMVAIVRAPSTGRVLWERAVLVLLEVAFLVNTRSISLLWVLLIVAAALVLAGRPTIATLLKKPAVITLVAGSAVLAIVALYVFTRPSPYTAFATAPNSILSIPSAFVYMVEKTFDYANGYVGIFGWLDTPSPSYSIVVWSAVIVVLLIASFIWGSSRSRWIAVGFGVALFLVPPITQALLAPHLGIIWQGRYMLAIFICLLVAAGMAIDESFAASPLERRTRVATLVGLILLGAGQTITLVWVLRRYVIGTARSSTTMFTHPLWQPPLTWEVLTVLMILWSAVAVFVAYRWITGSALVEAPGRSAAKPLARKKVAVASR